MEKIQHFSHKHPLILNENWRWRGRATCDSSYSCKECDYNLHKSCAELPRELQHPLHRKHALILLPEPPYDPKQFQCKACDSEKNNSSSYYGALFVYHCSLCKFDLDIKCASLPLTMEVESHDHPFTLFPKMMSFTCDACGKEDMGMPHQCAKCGICIHSKCASSTRTVKNLHHKHPLKLTYSLQNDQSNHWFCQICVEKVNLDYWVYHCSICDFVAHCNCAMNEEIRDEDAELNETIDTLPYIVKKTNLEGDGTQIATEINISVMNII